MGFAVGRAQLDLAGAGDFAYAGDRCAGDRARDASVGWSGEEQFVVFSAMQGVLQFVVARCGGQGGGIDDGSHAAFIADVTQVGGESVAGVDHGGGEFLLTEVLADSKARVRIKVARMRRGAQLFASAQVLKS